MPLIPYKQRLFLASLSYLWEVFECSEGDDAVVAVEHRDGHEGGFNEFEDLRVGVDAVVHVVLSNLNQVNNLIAVIWVCAAEDNALKVELALLLVDLHISFHLFLCFLSL